MYRVSPPLVGREEDVGTQHVGRGPDLREFRPVDFDGTPGRIEDFVPAVLAVTLREADHVRIEVPGLGQELPGELYVGRHPVVRGGWILGDDREDARSSHAGMQ